MGAGSAGENRDRHVAGQIVAFRRDLLSRYGSTTLFASVCYNSLLNDKQIKRGMDLANQAISFWRAASKATLLIRIRTIAPVWRLPRAVKSRAI